MRRLAVGLALALIAAAPWAVAQKMYKCSDGKGGTTFQQSPCPETAQEAEARAKERERLQAEEARKKEEAARKKEEAIQKARERDKAYQEQAEKKAAEDRKRSEEASKSAAPAGTMAAPAAAASPAVAAEDRMLPEAVARTYPGPWRAPPNTMISNAIEKKKAKDCAQFKYRQHSDGPTRPFLVACGTGAKPVYYLMWPSTGAFNAAEF